MTVLIITTIIMIITIKLLFNIQWNAFIGWEKAAFISKPITAHSEKRIY